VKNVQGREEDEVEEIISNPCFMNGLRILGRLIARDLIRKQNVNIKGETSAKKNDENLS
jgi:hypothetical protein